jgi:hypothetical protein
MLSCVIITAVFGVVKKRVPHTRIVTLEKSELTRVMTLEKSGLIPFFYDVTKIANYPFFIV